MIETLRVMTQSLVHGNERTNRVVSVLPSVGVRWLTRALHEFLREHPDLRVDLRLEEDPVDFFRTRIDVRVSYGEHIYPEFVTSSAVTRALLLIPPGHPGSSPLAHPGRCGSSSVTERIFPVWRSTLRAPARESPSHNAGSRRMSCGTPFKTTIDLQYRYCAVHAPGQRMQPERQGVRRMAVPAGRAYRFSASVLGFLSMLPSWR